LADALNLQPGARCLDIGCGTGVLTRELARRVGPANVVGLDRNEGMLEVARRHVPEATWVLGRAEELPFDAGTFSSVGCQFALMFFDDRDRALQEMWRTLAPGGRLALAVWGSLEATPGYAAMAALLKRLFGSAIADELRAPFCLGERAELETLMADSGLGGANIETVVGRARFPSIASWVHTDVRGWTLADKLNDEQFAVLASEAERALGPYVVDGQVDFDSPAHIITLSKPSQ
jgi:SAM-dependent methyltransferase